MMKDKVSYQVSDQVWRQIRDQIFSEKIFIIGK